MLRPGCKRQTAYTRLLCQSDSILYFPEIQGNRITAHHNDITARYRAGRRILERRGKRPARGIIYGRRSVQVGNDQSVGLQTRTALGVEVIGQKMRSHPFGSVGVQNNKIVRRPSRECAYMRPAIGNHGALTLVRKKPKKAGGKVNHEGIKFNGIQLRAFKNMVQDHLQPSTPEADKKNTPGLRTPHQGQQHRLGVRGEEVQRRERVEPGLDFLNVTLLVSIAEQELIAFSPDDNMVVGRSSLEEDALRGVTEWGEATGDGRQIVFLPGRHA